MPDCPSLPPAAADTRWRLLRLEALTVVALSCGGASLSAGPLTDPTRPPPHLAGLAAGAGNAAGPGGASMPGPARSGAADSLSRQTAAAAAAAAAAAEAPAAPLPTVTLQAVQSPARGQSAALINGQLVKVGDPVAGRQVTSIDAQGVVLRGPAGNERLWLLGDSTKQQAGSIQTQRSTQFTPAPDSADGTGGGDTSTRAERSTSPGALSLARRTQP